MMFAILLSLGVTGYAISALFDGGDDTEDTEKVERGGDASEKIVGDDGHDVIKGGDGNDTISGQGGEDFLEGGGGDDKIDGGDYNDLIEGNDGQDTLSGGRGTDVIFGNAGDDVIEGGKWNDALVGGEGNDLLKGGSGNDVLFGDFETIKGDGTGMDGDIAYFKILAKVIKTDPDSLKGLSVEELKNDPRFDGIDFDALIQGPESAGVDTLEGGEGDDQLYLGAGDEGWGDGPDAESRGADSFILHTAFSGKAATIHDYVAGQDKIVIEYDAKEGAPKLTFKQDGEDALVYVDGEIIARVDNAGSGLSAQNVKLQPIQYA